MIRKGEISNGVEHWKAKGLDFSNILYQPRPFSIRSPKDNGTAIRMTNGQADKTNDNLDWQILKKLDTTWGIPLWAEPAIKEGQKTCPTDKPLGRRAVIELSIRNTHRTVGAILSNRIVKKYGPEGLPDNTLEVVFRGSAGQSFGAFLAPGVTLKLIGESNDYLGKGLSGGRIVVKTPDKSPFLLKAHENIIVGNTVLYGATAGEVFINGIAGERFCVRNSGATAVVEGVGDHGCEYMTGGIVVVLGKTGCNFAAGMSGGLAYVLDEMQLFDTLCNLDMVELENIWQQQDKELLHRLIVDHIKWTQSKRACDILDAWSDMIGKFVKVVPIDYRKALEKMQAAEQRDAETTPATEEVFSWVR